MIISLFGTIASTSRASFFGAVFAIVIMSLSTFSTKRIIILLISFLGFYLTLNFLADDNIFFFSYLKYTLFDKSGDFSTEALTKYSSGRSEMWSLVIGNVLDGKHIFFGTEWD